MDERERIDDQQPEDLEVRDDQAEDVKGGLNFASQGEVVPTDQVSLNFTRSRDGLQSNHNETLVTL